MEVKGHMISLSLFRHFLKTPNFIGWYNVRREEANQKLRLIHLDMVSKAVSGTSLYGNYYNLSLSCKGCVVLDERKTGS